MCLHHNTNKKGCSKKQYILEQDLKLTSDLGVGVEELEKMLPFHRLRATKLSSEKRKEKKGSFPA